MKPNWKWIERMIWFAGLLYAIIQWRVDVNDMKGDLDTLKQHDAKQEQRWEAQMGLNGRFGAVSDHVLGAGGTTEEEGP